MNFSRALARDILYCRLVRQASRMARSTSIASPSGTKTFRCCEMRGAEESPPPTRTA